MRTPDGRLRAPTPAEEDLADAITAAVKAAATDRVYGRDPSWLAAAATSAVLDRGWTPPTTHRPDQGGHHTTEGPT